MSRWLFFSRQSPGGSRQKANGEKSLSCRQATGYWLLIFSWLLVTGYCLLIFFNAFAAETKEILFGPIDGKVDEKGLPLGWQELTFAKIPQHTKYTVIKEDGQWVIQAQSRSSASALIKELELDPKQYPILEWRWKIKNTLPKGDESKKAGDDYAARIYITFKYIPEKASASERVLYALGKTLYGKYPPKATLNYIWANKLPQNQAVDSPYTGRAKLIAVESGPALAGRWITEERNIYEDYLKNFGAEPPPINGVAVMTDSDNTQGEAEAYYAGIVLKGKE